MFAQLGKTVFQAVFSFAEDSEQGAASYAEHALLDGKPRLQKTGVGLTERSIKIMLHNSFCVPQDELNKLKDSRDQGEILPLIWGNGLVEGDFVITDLSASKEDVAPNGTVICYSVSINLKEFVSPNKLQSEQDDNRNKAKAVGNKKPVAKPKKNKSTCPQIVARIVSSVVSHSQQISSIILEKGGMVTLQNKNNVISHLRVIRSLCDKLNTICDDATSCAHPYPDIKYRSIQCQNAVDNWNSDISNKGAVPTQLANNQIMNACVRNLNAAAQPLITQAIQRKG